MSKQLGVLGSNPDNLLLGKGKLYFKKNTEDGFIELGNAPSFSITSTTEKLEHFSSQSGIKTKDKSIKHGFAPARDIVRVYGRMVR